MRLNDIDKGAFNLKILLVLGRFPFVNLQSVSVGFYEKTVVHGSVSVFTVPDFNHVQSKH